MLPRIESYTQRGESKIMKPLTPRPQFALSIHEQEPPSHTESDSDSVVKSHMRQGLRPPPKWGRHDVMNSSMVEAVTPAGMGSCAERFQNASRVVTKEFSV
jgi:hypothetical protein